MTISIRKIFISGAVISAIAFSTFLYYDTKDYVAVITTISSNVSENTIEQITKNNSEDYEKFSSCPYPNSTSEQNNFKSCILEKAPTVTTAIGAYLFTQAALMYLNTKYDDKDVQELAKLTLQKSRQYIEKETPIHKIMSMNIAKAHNKSIILVALYGEMEESPSVNLLAEMEKQLNLQEIRILHPELVEERQQKIREAIFSPII